MTQQEQLVLDTLDTLGILYDRIEHPALFTVEDAKIHCKFEGAGWKNLFLVDKNKNYYLSVLKDDKRADLKSMSAQLSIKGLSFASADDLYEILGLTPGAVTPFGLINDEQRKVTVLLDSELENHNSVSFHPNVNTATLVLDYVDFERFLKWTRNPVKIINT